MLSLGAIHPKYHGRVLGDATTTDAFSGKVSKNRTRGSVKEQLADLGLRATDDTEDRRRTHRRPTGHKLEFPVPAQCVGRVIGKGGATIRGLCSEFRVHVAVVGDVVQIEGPRPNTGACRHRIESMMVLHPQAPHRIQ